MNQSTRARLRLAQILAICGVPPDFGTNTGTEPPEPEPEPEIALAQTTEKAYEDVMAHMDSCSGCAGGPLSTCSTGHRLMEHWVNLRGVF